MYPVTARLMVKVGAHPSKEQFCQRGEWIDVEAAARAAVARAAAQEAEGRSLEEKARELCRAVARRCLELAPGSEWADVGPRPLKGRTPHCFWGGTLLCRGVPVPVDVIADGSRPGSAHSGNGRLRVRVGEAPRTAQFYQRGEAIDTEAAARAAIACANARKDDDARRREEERRARALEVRVAAIRKEFGLTGDCLVSVSAECGAVVVAAQCDASAARKVLLALRQAGLI